MIFQFDYVVTNAVVTIVPFFLVTPLRKLSQRPCQGGSRVACLNLKMSRVAVLSLSVVKLKENCLSLSEVKFFHKGCCLSRFYFMCCRYFLCHVTAGPTGSCFFLCCKN